MRKKSIVKNNPIALIFFLIELYVTDLGCSLKKYIYLCTHITYRDKEISKWNTCHKKAMTNL